MTLFYVLAEINVRSVSPLHQSRNKIANGRALVVGEKTVMYDSEEDYRSLLCFTKQPSSWSR